MLINYLLLVFLFLGVRGSEDDVIELTDSDFSTLANHENSLVMFYAPWCGHCKRLKPEFAKAAELLKDNDPPISLIKVDCTEGGKESCNKFSVSGYPTLKIFAGSDMVNDYNGPREAAGIAKYMKGQVGPASKKLSDVKALEAFLDSNDVGIVGFFEKEDSSLATTFQTVAKKLREKFQFAHTSEKSVIKEKKMKDNIVLYRPKVLHNKFEDDSVTYEGQDSIADIIEFISSKAHGMVAVRTRDNHADFKNPLVVAYYNVDYKKNPKGSNYWRNRILKVAKNFPKLNFAISAKDDFQHELNEFGVEFSDGKKPIALARNEKNQKFVMQDEFTVETFEKFLTDLEGDKLEVYMKSEAIPEDNSGNVKVAVSKNFDDIVMNNDKDILIEFYAPWCGHCKQLAPIFDELGDKMANEDVEIVKMDATANDVPPLFEVRGFPTLFWLPKDSKDKPMKYEGGRQLDDFVKYIAKHSTEKLKGFNRKGEEKKSKEEL
ncbi:protein disulfide-isomerase A3 [Leptopilina boulardi]|uniref:protein disulfide-isomerase A3 n=1 Tax=Leptopilina boulardi TaxID=63433 RepID=UPI0021F60680|nr:protein disulfide-isomerase A3 [Leptopilina boulardi]